ncbi:MAG: haloacid dehalogenase-like hydrolase [Oscillospiraceae bacterium]|nr:haloacid dehalogenase-like hydrolase [Oscillospiraceae bacterium]
MTAVFDWDGTLHNTAALYGHALRAACRELAARGYTPPCEPTDEEASVYLGMNAPDMWNRFFPSLPESEKKRSSAIVGRVMVEGIASGAASLYPEAESVLAHCKARGWSVVILSNCEHAYMEAHRRAFNLDRWVDGYYCCEDFDFRPKTEIFSSIRAACPPPYVIIGDRQSDMQVAEAHSLPFIACLYGFGGEGELDAAPLKAAACSDLPALLDKLAEK